MGLSNQVILVLLIPSRMSLAHDLEIHGNAIIDDDDEEDIPTASAAHVARQNNRKDDVLDDSSYGTHPRPSASGIHDFPGLNKPVSLYCHLLCPFNMNGIRSAEQEKALCELVEKLGASELEVYKSPEGLLGNLHACVCLFSPADRGKYLVFLTRVLEGIPDWRWEAHPFWMNSTLQKSQPLGRRRSGSRSMSSGSVEFARQIACIPSIPE